MSGPEEFFAWALESMARRHTADADAPVFECTYHEAQALPGSARELVRTLPDGPTPAEDLLPAFERLFGRHIGNARSPRFQNQLFSGVLPEALAGHLLGIFTHTTLSTREVAPIATEIEHAVVDWLLRLLPWDGGTAGGTATPAGSFSNYLAVYLARKRAVERLGDDAVPRLAILASDAAHYSIEKGADLAGIPLKNVLRVESDETGHMRVPALVRALADARSRGLEPCMVTATLGTTVAGVLDPVAAIADALRDEDVWLHVDAAWGGLGLCGSEADRFRAGVDQADSVTWDAHKVAASPVALSFLMVRDRSVLDALRPQHGGGYLFRESAAGDEDLGLTSLYCGKPFLSLGLWLAWKARGASGMRAHADRAWDLARRFRDRITASERFDLVQEPETPVVCFRPRGAEDDTPEARRQLVEAVRARAVETGEWLIRVCPLGGEHVLRAIFVNPHLDEGGVDALFEHLEASCDDAERNPA